MTDNRTTAIRTCRDLEQRCVRIGHSIGAQWAHGWANDLLDTRTPASFYANWIDQLKGFVERREAMRTEQAA